MYSAIGIESEQSKAGASFWTVATLAARTGILSGMPSISAV